MDVAAVPKADYEYFSVFYSDSTAVVLVLNRCFVPHQYQLVVLFSSVQGQQPTDLVFPKAFRIVYNLSPNAF